MLLARLPREDERGFVQALVYTWMENKGSEGGWCPGSLGSFDVGDKERENDRPKSLKCSLIHRIGCGADLTAPPLFWACTGVGVGGVYGGLLPLL